MYGFLIPYENDYRTVVFSDENNKVIKENIQKKIKVFTIVQDVPYLLMPHVLSYDECILRIDLDEWVATGMVAGCFMAYPLRFV